MRRIYAVVSSNALRKIPARDIYSIRDVPGNLYRGDQLHLVRPEAKELLSVWATLDLAHIETWELLSDWNVDICHNDAIIWAAQRGHLEVVKFLIEHGVDKTEGACWGACWAALRGHRNVLKFLVRRGVDIHYDTDYMLRWAAKNGHLDAVKYLFGRGANIHARSDESLRWAAQNGHLEVVKFLVEKGANIRARKDDALMQAVIGGHREIVRFLVSKGSIRPLVWVADAGCLDYVKLLVECGANARAENALRQAYMNGHYAVVIYLIAHGADVREITR